MPQYTTVLIIDFGSPYTQRVARRVREAGIYSVILPCTASEAGIRAAAPSAIIISGGPDSVCAPEAPALNPLLLELGVPVLGICHGMQVLAQALGGNLAGADAKNAEYAEAQVEMTAQSPLWEGLDEKDGKTFAARMAFGDRITALPPGCSAIAAAPGLPVAAIADPKRRVYGVQFHPEAPETRQGTRILRNFLFGVAGLAADWDMDAFVERAVAECREKTAGSKVVLALSGGIDSTVVAAILHRAIGDKLHCVFVDHGLMRQNEPEEVVAMLRAHLPGLNLRHVDARKLFLGRLAGVDDPEEKRKIIGHSFIELFEREARAIPDVRFLAQGTVYPDVIESYSPKGLVIKSHHNVGGLPEDMKLALVEPLRELFKDEVRAVGERLGLPEHVVWRQPFPGPGLAVRVLGEVTEARLAVLRFADHIVRQEVRTAGLERSIWQSFAVLLPLRTVGVRGEARTYEHVVALRAVNSVDAMTAEWARLPHELLESISRRILGEVAGVNRVVFDISSKPPSTIEWE